MIRLDLTEAESLFLQHCLEAAPPGLDPAGLARPLLAKVAAAHEQALRDRLCPVCQQSFTQLRRGRIAQYCSHACKQKAYRSRRDQWQRWHGPPPAT